MAMESQGVTLYWCTSTVWSMTAPAKILCPISWAGPSGAAAAIDVTCLDSTSRRRVPGLRDEGELSFTVVYSHTDTAHQSLIDCRKARTKRAFAIVFGDASSSLYRGKGYCSQFSISGAVDDAVRADVSIVIDGGLTFTTM